MMKFFFGALCLCLSLGLHAQTLYVFSEKTDLALKNVTVTDNDTGFTETTNKNGKLDLKDFTKSNHIVLSKQGYQNHETSYAELSQQAFTIALITESLTFDELVVSANKWQQTNSDVPQQIKTISQEESQILNSPTSADLLGNLGGVFIQKSQLGGGSPMMRGFAANRVLITVDGIRMNNAIFRSGNLQNVIGVDANSVGRTEVVLGPGSLIYGSDAIGGVMTFFTLQPKLSNQKKINLQGNSLLRYSTANKEKTSHINFNLYGAKFSSLTSFTFSDFDDLIMGKHGPDEYLRTDYVSTQNQTDMVSPNSNSRRQVGSGYHQLNFMQKFRYDPNPKWSINYALHYSETSDVPRYDRLIEKRNNQFRSAEWYYGPQLWVMNHLNILSEQSTTWYDLMNVNFAQQFFKESRNDRKFNNQNLRQRTEQVNVYSANFDFTKSISQKSNLFYGAELLFNQVNSTAKATNINTQQTEPISTRYPDGSNWNSYAAYASYELKPNNHLTLQGGLRYNYVSSHSEFDDTFFPFPFKEANIETGALNGNIGGVYKPNNKTEINALFSTGFRAPNIDDIGKIFDSEPGNVIVPNNQLEYEYAYNAEAGIKQLISNKIKLDFTAYYTHLTDALVRDNFNLNGQDSIVYDGQLSNVEAIQNAASTKVWGVNFGAEAILNSHFKIRKNISYQSGFDYLKNGIKVPARHVAPLFGDLNLNYENKRLKALLQLRYNGPISFGDLAPSEQNKPHIYAKDSNGNPYSPAWYTIHLKSSYQVNNVVSLNFAWENITNQRYRPYSSGIVAAGSNFIFAIRTQF